jgi:molybdopterin/thiamine biosynthesis adenylyltransferase
MTTADDRAGRPGTGTVAAARDPANRYARHVALPQIGAAGQVRLERGRVLVVGLGGLGCPAALYLASSGVGELWLNDFDRVDISNLQRQVLYREGDVGARKVTAAADALAQVNTALVCHELDQRLQGSALDAAVAAVDVVLDGSDNFATRFAVNAACARARKPLVSGAAIRFEGQLGVFRHDLPDAPCYRCLYDESADDVLENCRGNGVFAPLVGTVGAMMAGEALKLLLGTSDDRRGRLLVYDALALSWRALGFERDPGCPVCGDATAAG